MKGKGKGPEDMTGKGKGAEPQMEVPPKTPERVNSPWDQYHPSSPSEGKGHTKGPHLWHPEWGPLEPPPIVNVGPTGMHWAQSSAMEKEIEFGRAMRIGATNIDGKYAVQGVGAHEPDYTNAGPPKVGIGLMRVRELLCLSEWDTKKSLTS